MAFLERVKEDFNKRYGGGKATTAQANSLNREFGYYKLCHQNEKTKISTLNFCGYDLNFGCTTGRN